MEGALSGTGTGFIKVFSTNGGSHSVETITAMSMHSLVDIESNPVRAAEVRAKLEDLYSRASKTIRFMFAMADDEKTMESREVLKRSIVQIIARDFNTLLDIERQITGIK